MARYKYIDTNPRLIPVDLAKQLHIIDVLQRRGIEFPDRRPKCLMGGGQRLSPKNLRLQQNHPQVRLRLVESRPPARVGRVGPPKLVRR